MNCLIFLPEEILDQERARVCGERAREVCALHELKTGLNLKAGVLGGKLGTAIVEEIKESQISFRHTFTKEPPGRPNISLVVAVPRPQTVKKVLQTAAVYGISRVFFVRSQGSVKSYLQSPHLKPENLQKEILLGLEQACDTIAPIISLHQLFVPFVEDELAPWISSQRSPSLLLADTRASQTINPKLVTELGTSGHVVIAIGPESGWSSHEVEMLAALGFKSISLGDRILRVEQATLTLLSQVLLAKELGEYCPSARE